MKKKLISNNIINNYNNSQLKNYIKNLLINCKHHKDTPKKIEIVRKLIEQNNKETKEFVNNLFKCPLVYLACKRLYHENIILSHKGIKNRKAIYIDEKKLGFLFETMLKIVNTADKKNVHLQDYGELNYGKGKLPIYRWRENEM